jgi:anti-anti-sigma regulatory factor
MRTGTVTVTPCDSKGTWLVMLHGEHDLATSVLVEQQTQAIWPLCKIALIDLSEATFIDSGVIRWLLSVERELAEAGAFTLSVVEGPSGTVADRLFGLLRMRYAIDCYATREDALARTRRLTRPSGTPLHRAGAHQTSIAWRDAA